MKTLSDDITINVSTNGMSQGYVVTTIYARGLGVFTGQSYISGDNSKLTVNVNDIAAQNRGKYDYLKLNDSGSVETVPLVDDTIGTISYQRRFYQGQIGEYKVNITDGTLAYNSSTIVLAGYDYPNKDLKPLFADDPRYPNNTSLGRIMQGCDWQYIPEDEIGNFQNLLLPHYPLKLTAKYGFGLQLYAGTPPTSAPNQAYSLRRDIGSAAHYEKNLGSPIYGYSNTTYLSLATLVGGISQSVTSDYDVPVYLKKTGSSGDEFGDWEEGYEAYYGTLNLDSITVYGDKAHGTVTIGTFTSGADFNSYLQRYMDALETGWNYNVLVSGNRVVYTTGMKRWEAQVTSELNTEAARFPLVGVDPEPSESEYLNIVLQPNFSQIIQSDYIPDKFLGTCPVAILDACYSRYYLAWYDRYGDVQSQAFDGKITYSESISQSEITDYKMRKRVVNNEVKPTWKLSTKWISQDIYPMYESIFTSPYLLLYDTETDRSWNVIVTDNKYTEKTYKNQKSLISLDINVEANKTQNNIF